MERGEGAESVSHPRVVSRTRRVETAVPVAVEALDGPHVAWLPPEGPSVVGCGAAATVTAGGPDRFEAVRDRARDLFAGVDATDDAAPPPRLFGGFAFAHDRVVDARWRGFPDARFVLPAVQVSRGEGDTWVRAQAVGPDAAADAEARLAAASERLAVAHPPEPGGPGVLDVERSPTRPDWDDRVETVLSRIAEGGLRKVVLAGSLAARLGEPFDLGASLARLDALDADTHRFAVAPGEGPTFVGATPERLVTKRGAAVETEALAGSIGRGDSADADAALAERLVDSEKDQHEHGLVVDAIRDQLAPLAADVETGPQSVRTLETVQHLHTPLRATLADDAHVLDVVERLHPTPAVGGLPPAAALRTIRETEPLDRGWYAGPVGWVGPDGDGDFAVAIRSAVVEGRDATLYAGNGIVADSDPADEWAEVQLKFEPMLEHLR